MFYIARNSMAITRLMTKKAALAVWAEEKNCGAGKGCFPGKYTLCRHTDKLNPTVVMELN